MFIYRRIARKIPSLDFKLKQAGLPDTPEEYVKKTSMTALFLTLALLAIIYLFIPKATIILLFPILFGIAFVYFLNYVDLKIKKADTFINQEIVFAGRFLIIQLESGVPMYKAFMHIAKNYEHVGKAFGSIVEKVDLGTAMEDALSEIIDQTPSENLRRMLWQILNSIKTGSDVTESLNIVIEQIIREQQIAVNQYARKLNPLAMFYMMVAIIVPSLGTTMLIVMSTFIGFKLTLPLLFTLAGVVGFIQFMFLSIIKSARPPMEL
ncbi:hypothetical protein CMO92_02295 [Candidatus Woesearchaeota archaeon]|nr:hypothetical protein [Candidatus Woesearchaeota archaeon]